MSRLYPAALILAVVATPGGLGGQATAWIAGQLRDRDTHQPLGGAAITMLGTPLRLSSTSGGEFVAAGIKPGTYVLQARALGYAPGSWVIELVARETLSVMIELEAAPITLPGMTVEGVKWQQRGMAGFAERRERGRGFYVTEDNIKQADAVRLSDVLRNVPGVRLTCRYTGCRIRMARAECQPDFYVDGLSANNSTTLDMPLIGVIGIEIYRTTTETPVDFLRSNNTCGTIVIWTRSGP